MKRLLTALLVTLFCFSGIISCGGDSAGPNNDTEAPSAPANLNGISGDQTIELNWNANNDDDDVTGYNLYRSTGSFSTVSEMNPVNGSEMISSTTYTDTELDNGTTYYYRITAVDGSGNVSEASSELEVTPFSNPPDRP